MKLYIGAYTSRLNGEGFTVANLEGDKLEIVDVARELADPLYATISKDKRRLYVAGVDSGGEAVCALYDATGDSISFLSAGRLGAPDCCHIELSPDERFAYAACYTSGRVAANKISGDKVEDALQTIQLTGGSRVNPVRQDKAHAHQITFEPGSSTRANVVDLGSDQIITYARDEATGALREIARMNAYPGSGPRHIDYAPDGRHAFLAYELGNLASVLEFDGGEWKIKQTLSTIPDGFAGETYCGAIRYDSARRALYVTNRGHDSIAVFDAHADYSLSLNRIIPCGGNFPRDLWLMNDGRMLTANQLSGTVALIDQSGRVISSIKVNGAVSVCA